MFDFKDSMCKVKELKPNHFPDRTDIKYTWLVMFYEDGDDECLKRKAIWHKLAASLEGLIKVGAVDASKYPELRDRYGVSELPTVFLFKKGRPMKYEGSLRVTKTVKEWATNKMSKKVRNLRVTDDLVEYLDDTKQKPHVILITDKFKTSSLYKAMSWKYRDNMLFGEVRAGSKSFESRFPTNGRYPTLYVIPSVGEPPEKYKGRIKQEDIDTWLKSFKTWKKKTKPESSSWWSDKQEL